MPVSSGIERAMRVIYFLAGSDGGRRSDFGVSEIARGLDMSKTVVHRVLSTLVAVDFLAVDPATRRYRLGPGAVTVGRSALEQLDAHRVARPHMERLAEVTGETITLSMRRGPRRVYLDQILSQSEVHMSVQIGQGSPLYAGSSAKAILAALPLEEAAAYLDGHEHEFVAFTSHTLVERGAIEADLALIRARGYAVSRGERLVDAFSIASPIIQAGEVVFGAVSVCGPAQRFGPEQGEEHGPTLVRAAQAISRELGYQGSWFPTA
ncbi:MAG: IclR family transcriptional regulator [Thermoleophilia bacterium]